MKPEVIRPLIKEELSLNCNNKSVGIGFDNFVIANIDKIAKESIAQKYKNAFRKYKDLKVIERKTLVNHLLTYVERLQNKQKIAKPVFRYNLDDPLTKITGIGNQSKAKLSQIGINTIYDVLRYIPSKYIDLTKIKKISELEYGETSTVIAKLSDMKASNRRTKTISTIFSDKSGSFRVTFFNSPWLTGKLKIGETYTISGLVGDFCGPQMTNPEVRDGRNEGYIEPVYPASKELKQWVFKRIFKNIENHFPQITNSILPKKLITENKLTNIESAYRGVHYPKTIVEAEVSRNRLAIEELILLETALIKKRAFFKAKPGIVIEKASENAKRFIKKLPFTPTYAQSRCISEISTDIESGKPMNRLLHGDVGSGKTIVGLSAINSATKAGYQTAWIAPTEVLASQTYKNANELLSCEVAYLSGSTKKSERAKIKELLESEKPCLLIGTHAVLEDWVQLPNLGLAVIDEQHRFGVLQRSRLSKKGKFPHILVMSATPIPRTLAMTLYGDLDVSVVDEMPANRKPIKTKVFLEQKRVRVYQNAINEIKNGRQVYIVCPLVEESAKIEAVSATELFEELQKTHFKDFKCGLLHGRMKNTDKTSIMERFKSGEIDVLISTTVIEVGVDVPNATVMIIQNAERFGLAQLHQLRGRVGRGDHQSYCFLIPSKPSRALTILESTNDGLRVAEEDLKIRGPGEIGGTLQSGAPLFDSRLITPSNLSLLPKAREIAESIIDKDPNLCDKENQNMKQEIKKRFESKVKLVWVS